MSDHNFTCVVCSENGAHFVRRYRTLDGIVTHLVEYHDIQPQDIQRTTTNGDETPEDSNEELL